MVTTLIINFIELYMIRQVDMIRQVVYSPCKRFLVNYTALTRAEQHTTLTGYIPRMNKVVLRSSCLSDAGASLSFEEAL